VTFAWLRLKTVRIALALVALPLVARLAFSLTPPTWWVDPTRFVQPRDGFTVVDRHGAVLRHARWGGVDRRWVPLDDVAPAYVDAVVATEDARFWGHEGVDVVATLRALVANLRPWGKRSGASTITQQLVKRVYGRPMGLASKPLEILRAAALERVFTKRQILELYVNRVPFGDRIEGVERASEEYFGHPAKTLDVSEAALLAGIPQAPSATEPRRHLARALRRRDHVLARMVATGKLDETTRTRLASQPPVVLAVPPRPDEAPRFVEAALREERAGRIVREGPDLVTSLDLALQHEVERLLAAAVVRFESRGVTNGAAVVVDDATGQILAYVGAARKGATEQGGDLDLLVHARQPGSTLKAFAYELLFERGGTAATVLDDIALPRTGAAGALFEPKDYDGRERGPVRARVALASSLNLAALDAAGRVGEHALVERLHALGFHGVAEAERYGAAAVLGGVDTTPLDLAGGYVTLARGGTRVPLVMGKGPMRAGEQVMSAGAAALTRDVLSDAAVRRDAFGADLTDLSGGRAFALKTGTSSGWRDAWAAVFDARLTVVVWLGDPAGRPLGAVSGFEAAAPVAVRILAAATAAHAPEAALAPAPAPPPAPALIPVSICADTGLLPGPRCHHTTVERFLPGTAPTHECNGHDDHGDLLLPPRYADWIRRTHPAGVAEGQLAPTSDGESPQIREPRAGTRLLLDPTRGPVRVHLRATASHADLADADVVWEVDGARLPDPSWELRPGEHWVVAVWGGRRSQAVHLTVDRSE
jgi:penicillin-binding protein 1C